MIVRIQLGVRKLFIIQSSGVSAIQGLLSIEVTEGQSELSEVHVILWVPTIEGCLLSWAHCNILKFTHLFNGMSHPVLRIVFIYLW